MSVLSTWTRGQITTAATTPKASAASKIKKLNTNMLELNEKNLNVVCGSSGCRHRTPKYAGVFDGFKLELPKMVRD